MNIAQFLKDYGELISISLIPVIIWLLGIAFQNREAKRNAKQELFLTLMANRKKQPISTDWADALNTIDVVFQDNKKVRAAWRAYHDSLHPKSQHADSTNSFQLDLLSEIANSLGYKDLKQTELDRFYLPRYFGDQEDAQKRIWTEHYRVLRNSENFGTPRQDGIPEDEVQPED